MRISKMGMKNVKLSNLDEMYPAQDILFQTNQVKQYGSGVYAYDNIPLKVQDNIEEVIKKCFNKADCIEVQMPLLQQEEMWKRSGRYDNYIEEGVMMTSKTDKGNYCLAPTAEEAITTFVENRVTSHKQLPAVFYQIGPKFRNEIRNRGYLLRGKEFLMFDLYSFDKDEEGMMQTYKKIRDTYFEVFRKLQLDIVAVAADNGSMGGKNSEEIMALSRIGEDTILFDEDTKQGLNVEVLEKENAEQYLKEVYNINDIRKLHERKAVELGHIFALGTKYSESMQINYIDDQNNSKPFYMGCYGIGVSRVLGLIYENNIIKENDKIVGFSLPIPVTPYYAYLISNDKKKEDLEKLYSEFNEKDIDVIIDDVKGSIGEKIRNAKILGIPYIAIMGNNTDDGFVEIERTKDEITGRERDTLNVESKVEDVTQALMTMAKGSTRTKEVNELTKQIIAEAVSQEYAARGITANPASLYENSSSSNVFERRRKEMPTIGSWYKRIKQSAQSNTNKDYEFHYSYLLKVMKQYIREYNGQMAYFDGQSTFDLMEGAPLINIDISQLEERFARPLAQQILMSWIWEKFVKKNSEDKRKARQKRVIVDEAWMLLPFPEAVDFLNKMARRARKRNVSLAIISQRFQDFYEKPEAQAVLTSSDTKLFLAQDKSEIQQLKEVFKLSEGEASFLVTCSKGEGLLKVGQDTAVIQITPTRKEFEFVETNMNKLVANNQRDDQRNINKN